MNWYPFLSSFANKKLEIKYLSLIFNFFTNKTAQGGKSVRETNYLLEVIWLYAIGNSRFQKIFTLSMFLIFCVEFRVFSHLTRDLSQAKINVVTSWATDKITTVFTQNDNFDHFEWNKCHFVHLISLWQCCKPILVTKTVFLTGKNLFSLQVTLFSLQGSL